MERITCGADIDKLQDNTFLGEAPDGLDSSPIVFRGKSGVVYCEGGVKLAPGCKIVLGGDNALLVLRATRHPYKLDITVNAGGSVVFGRDCYFNGALHAVTSEGCSILVGNDCLFSFGIWIRVADPHLVYSAESKRRINPSRDVVIGDHVWIGQDAMLLKGTTVGSGSIVGAKALVAGKTIESNSSWGGNPAKRIAQGVFWEGSCVHTWTEDRTKRCTTYDSDEFIFRPSGRQVSTVDLSKRLRETTSANERFVYVKGALFTDELDNRFFIPPKRSGGGAKSGIFSLLRFK